MNERHDRFRMVLVGTRNPRNLGTAVRAMANMGFSRLYLVNPQCDVDDDARAAAASCYPLLDSLKICPSIVEAIADCGFVIGTTRRSGRRRRVNVGVADRAGGWLEIAEANEVAILFGPEDFGLSSHDLDYCDERVQIPTAASDPSLNLAQSVLLICYEISQAEVSPQSHSKVRKLAPAGQREGMLSSMEDVLNRLEYFGTRNPEHAMAFFREMFLRATLSEEDVRMWRGVFARMLKRLGRDEEDCRARRGGPSHLENRHRDNWEGEAPTEPCTQGKRKT